MKNILIVEDDKFNIQLIEAIFTNLEMDVNILSTDDGDHALTIIADAKPPIDMLLLDLHLPEMSGEEILKEVRSTESLDDLPVLIISVDGLNEIELRELGANDFVLKPFDITEFSEKISKYLFL